MDDTERERREVARQRDFDDQQNELAGRDVGRQARFLSGNSDTPTTREKKDREREANLTRLQVLLSDPAYAEAYARVSNLLDDAEAATIASQIDLENRIAEERRALAEMEAGASELPDGTIVLRDAQGQAVTVDGRVLAAAEEAQVNWKRDAPSYEAYLALQRRLEASEAERDVYIRYQEDVLDDARARLDDQNAPLTMDELEELERNIQAQAPPCIQAALGAPAPTSAPGPEFETPNAQSGPTANLAIPTL
ncbi:MAG: hypothetical protein AAFQ84_03670 [Pseudomonadota bacterium]